MLTDNVVEANKAWSKANLEASEALRESRECRAKAEAASAWAREAQAKVEADQTNDTHLQVAAWVAMETAFEAWVDVLDAEIYYENAIDEKWKANETWHAAIKESRNVRSK
jgi:hypothetical protein